MPFAARPSAIIVLVEPGGDALSAIALVDVFVKDDTHDSGLRFIHGERVDLVLALVEATASDEVVSIGGDATLETSILHKLT